MNDVYYMTTMKFTKTLLKDGVITVDEYHEIEEIFKEKYKPVLGTLYSDISLTYTAGRVMNTSERQVS